MLKLPFLIIGLIFLVACTVQQESEDIPQIVEEPETIEEIPEELEEEEIVEEPVVCTQDAKICPDGTAVGRIPPDCEFKDCPVVEEVQEVVEETPEVIEPSPEPVKGEFQIFNPRLTYPGAYNGPLYATSEQVGDTAPKELYFENLDRNGVNYFIGMFTISGEPDPSTLTSSKGLGYIIDWVEKHPNRIVPFFNLGLGGKKEEPQLGKTLTRRYNKTHIASKSIVGDNFIKGLGEIETQEWLVRHHDPKVMQLFEIADTGGLVAMFHPTSFKLNDVERVVKAFPDTIFLIHMFHEDIRDRKSTLIDIMESHENLIFSIDAAHLIFDGNDVLSTCDGPNIQISKDCFISIYDSQEKIFIKNALRFYDTIVDAVPEQVVWGTNSRSLYNYEPEVYDRMIKISRLFIGELDPKYQEAVGYKNALRIFGPGVKLDRKIDVIDAS